MWFLEIFFIPKCFRQRSRRWDFFNWILSDRTLICSARDSGRSHTPKQFLLQLHASLLDRRKSHSVEVMSQIPVAFFSLCLPSYLYTKHANTKKISHTRGNGTEGAGVNKVSQSSSVKNENPWCRLLGTAFLSDKNIFLSVCLLL